LTVAGVAAGVVLAVGFWPGETGRRSGVAFAEVLQRISSARTATYAMTVEAPPQPVIHQKVMCMGSGLIRMETPDGTVTILDIAAHKTLLLLPAAKTAIRMEQSDSSMAATQGGYTTVPLPACSDSARKPARTSGSN
jgi:hypothetical protein